jgi:hypothetical protein
VRYEIVNKLFNVVALKIIKKKVADIVRIIKNGFRYCWILAPVY